MLAAYLGAERFATTTVGDGGAGVTAALSGHHDAVTLDIMLVTLSGMEALREIRRRSHVPIIMLTARCDNLDRVVGLEKWRLMIMFPNLTIRASWSRGCVRCCADGH